VVAWVRETCARLSCVDNVRGDMFLAGDTLGETLVTNVSSREGKEGTFISHDVLLRWFWKANPPPNIVNLLSNMNH